MIKVLLLSFQQNRCTPENSSSSSGMKQDVTDDNHELRYSNNIVCTHKNGHMNSAHHSTHMSTHARKVICHECCTGAPHSNNINGKHEDYM